MSTLLFSHPSSLEHDMGAGHPERPDRLRAVLDALAAPRFDSLIRRDAPPADVAQLTRVHLSVYVDSLLAAVPKSGLVQVDPDTSLSPRSGDAALHAAGAMIAAVDAVLTGDATSAFCAVRPPGHHAEPDHAKGFCLFNNVAIGAAHARAHHRVGRVAVVDFDVHHGNGTQAMFQSEPEVLYASSHEYPLFPGTGAADEQGVGNVFNVPLASGSGSAEFRREIERVVLPALEDFDPALILISAGFDAHARDPLASLRLEEEDFAWITARLVDIAGEHCDGRIISTLEGGYDLEALANSVTAHVGELMRA